MSARESIVTDGPDAPPSREMNRRGEMRAADADREIGARPLIIIGAGRSGTNMLRDVLTRLDGVATWPCDEINYIWRHGNRSFPTDEFAPSMATPAVRHYVRGRFSAMVKASDLHTRPLAERRIVEKTCANSLRVGFVAKVLPEALFVHIVRDGRDVVASARRRWTAPLDMPYLLAKARYVPPSDLAHYSSRYLINRLRKLRDPRSALSMWGPRFEGMRELVATRSIEYVCAAQWVRCVSLADEALGSLDERRVHRLRYEDFVSGPVEHLASICRFAGLSPDGHAVTAACAEVRSGTAGKGLGGLGEEAESIEDVMWSTLQAHGYE